MTIKTTASSLEIPYIKIVQRDSEFYLCYLEAKHLANITYVASRGVSTEEGAVQRILNRSRIGSIRDFLVEGGIFPNNVILNWVKPENLSESSTDRLSIILEKDSAQIIDGQHRIEGIKEALKQDPGIGNLQIPTVIAKNLDTSKCAEIFVNINTEQRTVPKSLIYDLYGIINAKNRDFSIDRATDIAKIFNDQDNSPYHGLIKFPGSHKFKGGIQLSTFVNNIKPLVKKEGELEKYSIRTLEGQGQVLINFFNALQSYYEDDWFILKNPFLFASGFGAAIDVFISKILPAGYSSKKFTEQFFIQILNLDKSKLPLQTDVSGMSGESARKYIKDKLTEAIKVTETTEEDFEI